MVDGLVLIPYSTAGLLVKQWTPELPFHVAACRHYKGLSIYKHHNASTSSLQKQLKSFNREE
jgi:hypothetical protein